MSALLELAARKLPGRALQSVSLQRVTLAAIRYPLSLEQLQYWPIGSSPCPTHSSTGLPTLASSQEIPEHSLILTKLLKPSILAPNHSEWKRENNSRGGGGGGGGKYQKTYLCGGAAVVSGAGLVFCASNGRGIVCNITTRLLLK